MCNWKLVNKEIFNMKYKDLEKEELKKRIMDVMGMELWVKATEIFKKKINYVGDYPINNILHSAKIDNAIKEIQMKLLDKEVVEAIKTKDRRKDGRCS